MIELFIAVMEVALYYFTAYFSPELAEKFFLPLFFMIIIVLLKEEKK